MKKSRLKVVIIGHVDHGKSTLIGRILLDTGSLADGKLNEIQKISKTLNKETELAYLADQFMEERENEMTVDTTQIFFKTSKTNCVIIDSPGHVEFIKHMLTGATQADAAILIIDALAGIQEQTRRHTYLINLLGIKNIIVVFNKMDLLGYKKEAFHLKKNELLTFLDNLQIKPLFIIPVSAKEGVNISKNSRHTSWYKEKTLLAALDSITSKKESSHKPLRLPVQDVYEIAGQKIIVGQIISGHISIGQQIAVLPTMKIAIVKSIKIFGRLPRKAVKGENVGIVLDDPSLIKRGNIIAPLADTSRPTKHYTGNIFWLDATPLTVGDTLTFRCATQQVDCQVKEIKHRMNSATLQINEKIATTLRTNETALVTLWAKKPVVIEKFDYINGLGKFVVGQDSKIQGFGIIT